MVKLASVMDNLDHIWHSIKPKLLGPSFEAFFLIRLFENTLNLGSYFGSSTHKRTRKKDAPFFCFHVLILTGKVIHPVAANALNLSSSPSWCRPDTTNSPRTLQTVQDFITIFGLLRHPALWTEELLHSLPVLHLSFHYMDHILWANPINPLLVGKTSTIFINTVKHSWVSAMFCFS